MRGLRASSADGQMSPEQRVTRRMARMREYWQSRGASPTHLEAIHQMYAREALGSSASSR